MLIQVKKNACSYTDKRRGECAKTAPARSGGCGRGTAAGDEHERRESTAWQRPNPKVDQFRYIRVYPRSQEAYVALDESAGTAAVVADDFDFSNVSVILKVVGEPVADLDMVDVGREAEGDESDTIEAK